MYKSQFPGINYFYVWAAVHWSLVGIISNLGKEFIDSRFAIAYARSQGNAFHMTIMRTPPGLKFTKLPRSSFL